MRDAGGLIKRKDISEHVVSNYYPMKLISNICDKIIF